MLKIEIVLHFLMVNGRLFHAVAAAFPYVTRAIFGTVISDSDEDLMNLLPDKE